MHIGRYKHLPKRTERKTTKRTILVIHMMRAGGHAIMEWLQSHFLDTDDVGVLNDIASPYSIDNAIEYINDGGEPIRNHTLLCNIEDMTVAAAMEAYYLLEPLYTGRHIAFNYYDDPLPDRDIIPIIVIRDPLSLFASRMEYARTHRDEDGNPARCKLGDITDIALNCWLDHADYALSCRSPATAARIILYDYWVKDHALYDPLIHQLNLAPMSAAWNKVSDYGGGSSFNGMNYDGRASEMDVLRRYRGYEAELFSLIPKDVRQLSDQLFPHRPSSWSLLAPFRGRNDKDAPKCLGKKKLHNEMDRWKQAVANKAQSYFSDPRRTQCS